MVDTDVEKEQSETESTTCGEVSMMEEDSTPVHSRPTEEVEKVESAKRSFQ